jgi:replicative DNA helicase
MNTTQQPATELPSNHISERAFLCSAMNDPVIIDKVIDRVNPEVFHLQAHGTIWEILCSMRNDKKPIDIVTVTNEAEARGGIKTIGGAGYLTEIYTTVSTTANWDHYLEEVEGCAARRRIIEAAKTLQRDCYDKGISAEELQERASKSIISMRSTKAKSHSVKDVLFECITNWENAAQNIQGPQKWESGLEFWDMQTRGMRPQTMHIIAGAAKSGKTTLALQMAANAAIVHKVPVGIISLEMSRYEIVNKISSGMSRIALNDLLDGKLNKQEYIRIQKTVTQVAKAPIQIVDEAAMNVQQFRARARRLVSEHQSKIILLDYAQLVEPSNSKENRERQVAEVSRIGKVIAKELDVCVILLCQLNEDGNVRESRSFYMDCDSTTKIIPSENNKDEVNLVITHNRHGGTGMIPCIFHRYESRFEEVDFEKKAKNKNS